MSKSYRKHLFGIVCGSKEQKKNANRKVRQSLNRDHDLALPNKSYRKIFDSWDILDWVEHPGSFEHFYERAIQYWERDFGYFGNFKEKPTKKECKNLYDKWYRRK